MIIKRAETRVWIYSMMNDADADDDIELLIEFHVA